MATLRRGSTGNDVRRLQTRLAEVGFSAGAIDGDFGLATDAAVRAFQASEGLLVDGVVGERTLAALGLDIEPDPPLSIAGVTVDKVRTGFPDARRDNIQRNLPFVLDGLVETELADKMMVLMALATVRAETAGFVPIDEGRSRFNTSPNGHSFDLYDHRDDLGNRGPRDGDSFKGRGFVQLTGRDNYTRIGREIGLGNDLVDHPERANEPAIAGRILAAFLKGKERQIKEALLDHDLKAARRLVNGGSHGITRFKECYRALDEVIE